MSEHITSDSHGHGHGHIQAHGHDHGHGHGHHAVAEFPFTEAEKKEFEKDDIFAGGAVVVEMSVIFGLGLILYIIVAVVVAYN